MQLSTGMVVSREDFLEGGQWSRQEYEGLLVSGNPAEDHYNIGVEIGDDLDLIVVVDQVKDDEVQQKVVSWSAQVPKIQRRYSTLV